MFDWLHSTESTAGGQVPWSDLSLELLHTCSLCQGYAHVGGVDEAGRGPLAGPVVAACCVIPPDVHFEGVADSKALDEAQREELYQAITTHPRVAWAV